VESDRLSTLQTAIDRGLGGWETEWRELFLPSVDLYMSTEPEDRADISGLEGVVHEWPCDIVETA
jgi:hypothetical protein